MQRQIRNVPVSALALALALALSTVSLAPRAGQAQEGESWTTLEPVYNVVTIRIHPNMGERYLNNLRKTWVTGVEEAKPEGITEDYRTYSSLTPNDGGYNLMIVTRHPNLAAFDATDAWREKIARIDARVQQQISERETDEITSTVYPQVRTILSEKMLREIEFVEGG